MCYRYPGLENLDNAYTVQSKRDSGMTFVASYHCRCPFHYRVRECKSRKLRNTWSNRQIWPWRTEWSRAKAHVPEWRAFEWGNLKWPIDIGIWIYTFWGIQFRDTGPREERQELRALLRLSFGKESLLGHRQGKAKKTFAFRLWSW